MERPARKLFVWLVLAVGLLVAITVILLRLTVADTTDYVAIGFSGTTNDLFGVTNTVIVFTATNTAPRTIRYSAWTEEKVNGTWPAHVGPLPSSNLRDVPPLHDFQTAVPPPTNDAPWRICIAYSLMDTRIGRARWKVAEFFYTHHLDSVGRLFHKGATGRIAEGPEMQGDRMAYK